jgi:SH3-like domain-containing protein
LEQPQGLIVAYSTQAGQTAIDGAGRNSPFTMAFLNHIETPDEIGTVFRKITAEVYRTTAKQQLPELSLSFGGEFYLRPSDSSGTGNVQATPGVVASASPVSPLPAAEPAASTPVTHLATLPDGPSRCDASAGNYVVINVGRDDIDHGLAIRASPNGDAKVLMIIPADAVGVSATACQNGWCKVKYNCREGWSSSRYLVPSATALSRVVGVDPSDQLNMREAPNAQSNKLASIPFSTPNVVVHVCESIPGDQSWCLTTYKGQSGWVAGRYLSRSTEVR